MHLNTPRVPAQLDGSRTGGGALRLFFLLPADPFWDWPAGRLALARQRSLCVPYISRLIASAFFLRFHHHDVSVWFDRTRLRAFLQKIAHDCSRPDLVALVKKVIVLASLTLQNHDEEKTSSRRWSTGCIKDSRERWGRRWRSSSRSTITRRWPLSRCWDHRVVKEFASSTFNTLDYKNAAVKTRRDHFVSWC